MAKLFGHDVTITAGARPVAVEPGRTLNVGDRVDTPLGPGVVTLPHGRHGLVEVVLDRYGPAWVPRVEAKPAEPAKAEPKAPEPPVIRKGARVRDAAGNLGTVVGWVSYPEGGISLNVQFDAPGEKGDGEEAVAVWLGRRVRLGEEGPTPTIRSVYRWRPEPKPPEPAPAGGYPPPKSGPVVRATVVEQPAPDEAAARRHRLLARLRASR